MHAARVVFFLLTIALVTALVWAQNNPPVPLDQKAPTVPTAPTEPAERQIRKVVTFITMHCLRGAQPVTAQGTGFFIEVADSRAPGRSFVYLVTNRHVAMCWDDDRKPMQVQAFSIRMNMKDGPSQEFMVAGNLHWILPTRDSVDLAAVPLAPDPTKCDFRTIAESLLATDEVLKKESVSEGLKILFSGFFYQVPGVTHVEPILREGIIAMMPDEDLQTTTGKMGRVYLGEVHAFHGNSGSPVSVDVRRTPGYDYRLLGVVSGGYGEGEQNALLLETPLSSKPGNSGIAVIVPASELRTLLDEPTAVALRDAEIARLAQQAKKGN